MGKNWDKIIFAGKCTFFPTIFWGKNLGQNNFWDKILDCNKKGRKIFEKISVQTGDTKTKILKKT